MDDDVYKKLAKHLDSLPGGFPPTENGVELRILKSLFTPKEADIALKLNFIPEEPPVIARRSKISIEEAAQILEEMAQKGLILRFKTTAKYFQYMAAQFVVGIWEYQVNRLNKELISDVNEYIPTLFDYNNWKKVPQLRTIPVAKSITPTHNILPYEEAEKLVMQQKRFAVNDCICRKEHTIAGKGCKKPLESCLVFGPGVDYVTRNGIGRKINRKEVLDILKKAEKAGLVLQPSNSKKIGWICCCCGCCCQVLLAFKRHPNPASIVSTPFTVSFDVDTCKGCGVCVKRCQMDAFEIQNKNKDKNKDKDSDTPPKAVLDLKKCIGCGLCVTTCPTKSLVLVRKPEENQKEIPESLMQTMLKLGKARGKITTAKMIKAFLISKIDRLLCRF